MTDLDEFAAFVAQLPVFDYKIIPTESISVYPKVRYICKEECRRFGTTWACPPAVGTLEQCEKKIRDYPRALLFSSAAEITDLLNLQEMLQTRKEHEGITNEIGAFFRNHGYDVYILSTESCSICKDCTYVSGLPCRHPELMHPCLESHGILVQELAKRYSMEYSLGGSTILWFSLICIRLK